MLKRKILFIAIMVVSFTMSGIIPAQADDDTDKIINALNKHRNDLYEKVGPAVVIILAQKETPTPPTGTEYVPDIDKNTNPDNNKAKGGLGTGFFYDKSGIIITNSHVVHGSIKITVYLKNHQKFEARIIGDDPISDIAILKIDGEKDFPVLKLGSSKKIKTGHMVVALGAPFGLEQTYTHGIVSAKRSNFPLNPFGDYIQTDAAVNTGNSGGPLMNMAGEVVGINSIILSKVGENNGIALAISIDYAKGVINRLIKNGKIVRAFIGASVRELSKDEKKMLNASLGKNNHSGIYVESTIPNFPASLGGLKKDDIIIRINDQIINSTKQFILFVSYLNIDKGMRTYVVRGGTRALITLYPIKHPKF